MNEYRGVLVVVDPGYLGQQRPMWGGVTGVRPEDGGVSRWRTNRAGWGWREVVGIGGRWRWWWWCGWWGGSQGEGIPCVCLREHTPASSFSRPMSLSLCLSLFLSLSVCLTQPCSSLTWRASDPVTWGLRHWLVGREPPMRETQGR